MLVYRWLRTNKFADLIYFRNASLQNIKQLIKLIIKSYLKGILKIKQKPRFKIYFKHTLPNNAVLEISYALISSNKENNLL